MGMARHYDGAIKGRSSPPSRPWLRLDQFLRHTRILLRAYLQFNDSLQFHIVISKLQDVKAILHFTCI
jgi:hypothetical protein